MTTMKSLREERRQKKALDSIVSRWKVWAKETGLPRSSVNSGERNIRASGRPTATMKALQREFRSRAYVPDDNASEPSQRAGFPSDAWRLLGTHEKLPYPYPKSFLKTEIREAIKPTNHRPVEEQGSPLPLHTGPSTLPEHMKQPIERFKSARWHHPSMTPLEPMADQPDFEPIPEFLRR